MQAKTQFQFFAFDPKEEKKFENDCEVIATMIERKEAEETQIYSNKDMADLLAMAHKMRIEELKAQTEMEKAKAQTVKTQVNIQDNSGLPFGQGNYGKLLQKLIKEDK